MQRPPEYFSCLYCIANCLFVNELQESASDTCTSSETIFSPIVESSDILHDQSYIDYYGGEMHYLLTFFPVKRTAPVKSCLKMNMIWIWKEILLPCIICDFSFPYEEVTQEKEA